MTMFGRPGSEGFHMEEPSSYHRPDSEVIPAGEGDDLDDIGGELLGELTDDSDVSYPDVEDIEDDVDSDLLSEVPAGKVDLKSYLDPDDLLDSMVFASEHPTPPTEPEFLPPSEK